MRDSWECWLLIYNDVTSPNHWPFTLAHSLTHWQFIPYISTFILEHSLTHWQFIPYISTYILEHSLTHWQFIPYISISILEHSLTHWQFIPFICILCMLFCILIHDYTLCFTGCPWYNVSYYNYISIWPYYIVFHFYIGALSDSLTVHSIYYLVTLLCMVVMCHLWICILWYAEPT